MLFVNAGRIPSDARGKACVKVCICEVFLLPIVVCIIGVVFLGTLFSHAWRFVVVVACCKEEKRSPFSGSLFFSHKFRPVN